MERLTVWLEEASGICGMIHGPADDNGGCWEFVCQRSFEKKPQKNRSHIHLCQAKHISFNFQPFPSSFRIKACKGTDLSCVERRVTSPLKHVFVDVAVISPEDGIELLVVEVEGVDQCHGVGSQLTQQFLDACRNLQHLRHCQQSSLRNGKSEWITAFRTQTNGQIRQVGWTGRT